MQNGVEAAEREQGVASEIVEGRTSRIFVHTSGVVIARIRHKARQELADAKSNLETVKRLSKGVRRPLLVDLRAGGETGEGVRALYAAQSETSVAIALLVGSALSTMIANFFIKLNRPEVPTQMFTNENAAMAWLQSFQDREPKR